MASAGAGDGEPEFQIAPMIDVLLVLLVFFVMITSAQVSKVDALVHVPVSPHAKEKDPKDSKSEFPVNVRWDQGTNKGVLVVDEKTYDTWEDIIPIMEARNESNLKEQNHPVRIIIRADANLPAGEIQRIMNVIAAAGISDISFASTNQ